MAVTGAGSGAPSECAQRAVLGNRSATGRLMSKRLFAESGRAASIVRQAVARPILAKHFLFSDRFGSPTLMTTGVRQGRSVPSRGA